jgi:hypothetical protein
MAAFLTEHADVAERLRNRLAESMKAANAVPAHVLAASAAAAAEAGESAAAAN